MSGTSECKRNMTPEDRRRQKRRRIRDVEGEIAEIKKETAQVKNGTGFYHGINDKAALLARLGELSKQLEQLREERLLLLRNMPASDDEEQGKGTDRGKGMEESNDQERESVRDCDHDMVEATIRGSGQAPVAAGSGDGPGVSDRTPFVQVPFVQVPSVQAGAAEEGEGIEGNKGQEREIVREGDRGKVGGSEILAPSGVDLLAAGLGKKRKRVEAGTARTWPVRTKLILAHAARKHRPWRLRGWVNGRKLLVEDVYALMVAEINADASKSPYFQDIMPRKARFHLEMMMRRYASDKAEREMANGSNEKPPEGEAVELEKVMGDIHEDHSRYVSGKHETRERKEQALKKRRDEATLAWKASASNAAN